MATTAAAIAVEWEYQTDDAIMIPYVGGMVSDSFPEDFLVKLYYKLRHDGSLRRTLPDEMIHTVTGFVAYFAGKTMIACFEKSKCGEMNNLAGMVWLYDTHGTTTKRASIGVFFFKEYWGKKVIYEMGKTALRWFFKECNLTVILGTIAKWNRASVRYGKIMGFEVCGVIPRFFLKGDVSTDMVMVALKRETVLNG